MVGVMVVRYIFGQDDAYVEVLEDNEWKRELNKEIVDEKEGETLPSANVSTSPGASGGDNVSESAGASGGADTSRSPGPSGGAEVSGSAGASGGRNTTPATSRPD